MYDLALLETQWEGELLVRLLEEGSSGKDWRSHVSTAL